MNVFFLILSMAFVSAVLALVAYVLFELSPFGRQKDVYRDPSTHKRRFEAPNLEGGRN